MIHPTAIIHPSAEIPESVTVGPYCVIGEGVKLGEDCVLHNAVTLSGPTIIGARNRFYTGACIGGQTQDLKYAAEPTYLEVGDDNTFREFVTINRGTLPGAKTVVGSRNNLLAYCHVAHDCILGDNIIFSNNASIAGHVIVEDNVILGGMTAVHQFCRIGKFAITGGCSKIVQDVPPFMIADGNPAEVRGVNQIGLQRHGFEADIRPLKEAYKALFMRGGNFLEAVERLELEHGAQSSIAHLCGFIRSSQRGVLR